MKKAIILAVIIALASSVTGCGCQMSGNVDSTAGTTSGTTSTTAPFIDPTIMDPTFETNIPDKNINDNSTVPSHPTDPTDVTDNTDITTPQRNRVK